MSDKIWLTNRQEEVQGLKQSMRHVINAWGANDHISIGDLQEVERRINKLALKIDCAVMDHPNTIEVGDTDNRKLFCTICNEGDVQEEVIH